MRNRALALLALGLIPAQLTAAALSAPRPAPVPGQPRPTQSTELLKRSWQRLDAELRVLDQLLPSQPEAPVRDVLSTPKLPANLIRANQPATRQIQPADKVAGPPLDLPTPKQLQASGVAGLSLEQALAIAFGNSASLQAQREQVAAALASVQAAMGSYWPTIRCTQCCGVMNESSTCSDSRQC